MAVFGIAIAAPAEDGAIAVAGSKFGTHSSALSQVRLTASTTALRREVLGFADDYNLDDPTVGWRSWNFSLLSSVVYFALHVNSGDGALIKTDTGWNIFHNSAIMTPFIQNAHAHGTKVLVSVNLHDFSTGPNNQVCQGLDPTTGAPGHTIGEIVGQMTGLGIDGINVDYEGNITTCANGQTNRAEFVSFVTNLRAAMPAGTFLVVDTYAGSAEDNQEFFDIASLATPTDAFFVMSYDSDQSNWSETPLNCPSYCFNPISPLNTYRFNVTKSMSQYLAYAPSRKIILGQPYYGRRGCVPNLTDAHQIPIPNTNFVSPTYLFASTVRSQSGVQNFTSHRDPLEGVGEWDTWFDTDFNCNREQYFDDSISLSYKYDVVNQDDLRGVGLFTLDYGGGASELWSVLATHFSQIPGVPGNINACPGSTSASVSWTAAPTTGGAITSYRITTNPGGGTMTVPATTTFATVSGLTPGTAYTLTIQAINSSGYGVGGTTASLTPTGAAPVATDYVNWYDKASPGMLNDNIHILNTGATAASGCVMLTNQAVFGWTANSGQELFATFPQGTIGGPVVVTVNSGPAVFVSQRVQFNSSFNEVWAQTAAGAATASYINWYDKASPGMLNDNIHILNPGATPAHVSVTVQNSAPQQLTVAPGAETYATFGAGTIGGPVVVTSDQPVLASQRIQFDQSFNEVWSENPSQAATSSYFNWYDKASPGMFNDNIHLVNPGTSDAVVTIGLPGATSVQIAVPAGHETYATFPQGTIGGPVVVSSTQPVLASQRVQFEQSFNELFAGS
jgi:spore germination protein YaaH